ncbi:hypothetical protein ABTG69_20055, partial [Acinetobacter baumannii]
FGGGPSSVNPEPMADFMDFFLIGDGERSVPSAMEIIRVFRHDAAMQSLPQATQRKLLLWTLATTVPGIYVPQFYAGEPNKPPKPL